MKEIHAITLVIAMLAAACSTGGDALERQANAPESMIERLGKQHGYVQDKQGNWVPSTNKRSSFETAGRSPYFNESLGKKQFTPDSYGKKSWSGNSAYSSKTYQTSTNTSITGRDAGINGLTALTPGENSVDKQTYGTSEVSTSNARESSGTRLEKPSDAETDHRRRVYTQPEIIDYKKLRDISVEDSRKMLGR